jgi:glycosyltransferase involved in cell wall biosynthesis
MKLVYILNQLSLKDSTHNSHVIHLLNILSAKGVDVVLIIEKSMMSSKDLNVDFNVIIQRKSGIRRFVELFLILRRLNKRGYDKIFIRISTWSTLTAIIFRITNSCKIFYWNCGQGYEKYWGNNLLTSLLRYPTDRLSLDLIKNRVDFFVTGPESMLEYYNWALGVESNRMICLYNDINLSVFKSKSNYNIDPKRKVKLLYVKRISPIKGSVYYISYLATALLERGINFEMTVIGSGTDMRRLEQDISVKGLEKNVILLGAVPNSEIQGYYVNADIFLCPSLEEGFPRVLLEAMASGLPIISTKAGGTEEIVGKYQKDFIYDLYSRDEMVDGVVRLLKDAGLRAKLGQENTRKCQDYSTEVVAEQYINTLFDD